MPTHKSKSVSAHPCNHPFAATHLLFLQLLSMHLIKEFLCLHRLKNNFENNYFYV